MQSKRRIDVTAVSLVDLKAEIARRRTDVKSKSTLVPNVAGAVLTRENTVGGGGFKNMFKRPHSPPQSSNNSLTKPVDNPSIEDAELEKSRRSLQAKAKLYDALRQAAAPQNETPEENDADPLVDFERKAMEDDDFRKPDCLEYDSGDSGDDSDRYDHKQRRNDDPSHTEPVSIPDGPVTYAHLRQDEVRDHGTGFYAFSADAEARAAEQAALRELRLRTERARQQTEVERKKRNIAMATRLARLRARKGLPDVATAAASLLSVQEVETEPPKEEALGAPQLIDQPPTRSEVLGSDDLDIASMLRRLRDEAEQKQIEEMVTPVVYTAPVQNPVRKGTREWDRGKSMVYSPSISRPSAQPPRRVPQMQNRMDNERRKNGERDPEFAPPSLYR